MGLFGPSNSDILAVCQDTNQRVRSIQGTVDRTYVAILQIENCVRDIDSNVRVGNQRLGDIMSHQEHANQIAESIAADTETIARFGDFFAVAVANYEVAIAGLQAQLAEAQANDVDLSGVEKATEDLRMLADVFEDILDPDTDSPAPEDVPAVEPVDETPADVTAGDSSEAPADVAAPAEETPVAADETVTPVEETAEPAAAEDAPAVTDPAPTESSTDTATDDGTTQS